jgi:drug/metabolite transporter (DMT)-like permease
MVGVLVALACALSWATGSAMMKGLSKKLDPFTLNAPRTLIGGIALLTVAVATGRLSGFGALTRSQIALMVGSMAIGGGLGDSLYVFSMSRIGLSRAYPISAIYPAITLALGVVFLEEQVTALILAGLVLVVGGVLLISRPSLTDEAPAGSRDRSVGIACSLLAAAAWAISMVMLGSAVAGVDAILVTAIRLPALTLIFWVVVGARRTHRRLLTLSGREWGIIAAGGVIGWALGSSLLVVALSLLGPTRAAILTSTSPLMALPLSLAFLNKKLNRFVVAGTVLTVMGVALVS